MITRIAIAAIVLSFLGLFYLWRAPKTESGKLVRKLCTVNALSWLIVLPLLDGKGHPPLWLIVGGILWLINLPVLIAAVVSLKISYSSHEERRGFLAVSSLYLAANIIVLYVGLAVSLFWSSY